MTSPTPLGHEALCRRVSPEQFTFATTRDLPELTEIIGQARASQAVHFGIGMQRNGYNLYVMGPSGMGKHTMVRRFLEEKAATQEPPSDWCYVNNFDHPHKPVAMKLPNGVGTRLSNDMDKFIEELSTALPATFESDEYRSRLQAIEDALKDKQEKAFGTLAEAATAQNIKLFRTPSGFAFAPMKNDEVVGPDEFEKLPPEEQKHIEEVVSNLQERLQNIIQQLPVWRKETHQQIKDLNREMTKSVVDHLIDELKSHYQALPQVITYLDQVEKDIIVNVRDFLKSEEGEGASATTGHATESFYRYKVNPLITNGSHQGAPVVYCDNPTYLNLVGRAEHIAQFGTLVTNFTLLKPGALHEASGGYLMIDALKLLTQPFAWEGLKRALYTNQIRIESLEKMLSLISTVGLEPEPIPLDTKVVLLGDRMLYYLLHEYDPDFGELFKVQADFDEIIDRNDSNIQLYAQLIATLVRKDNMLPFDREAVARIIDYGSRHVEDSEKLTTHMRSIADLMHEAEYWARSNQREVVGANEIRQAIEQQEHRASRLREHIQEEMRRETIYIDTSGARVGQVNGLSVIGLGNYAFGQPSRITATVHIGEGDVVDIEREVELGGAIHSKGVMILSSFVAARYARKHPLSLSASLVFEQSYGHVDGDSASLAELCSLLSAIADIPIKQSFAMTGSVNQHGQVQPIGGVNEKIEGFFDLCAARGLDGTHGVLIPASNVKHLMLTERVVEASRNKQFHVWPVSTVDEAIQLLTGIEAGAPDNEGEYPAESVNGKVLARLREMAHIRQEFGEHHKHHDDDDGQGGTKEGDDKQDEVYE